MHVPLSSTKPSLHETQVLASEQDKQLGELGHAAGREQNSSPYIYSLNSKTCGSNLKKIYNLTLITENSSLGTRCEIPTQNPTNESTFVQVMAWCCQAPSHCLSQCWPRSMLSYKLRESHIKRYFTLNYLEFVIPNHKLQKCFKDTTCPLSASKSNKRWCSLLTLSFPEMFLY